MATFTAMWGSWAYASAGGWFIVLGAIFWATAAFLLGNAIHLFASLRRFPHATGVESEEGRKVGMRFGILFAAEGVVIGVVCGILAATDNVEFFAPAIALIVGLHFIPLAWVFQRRIDLWLGSFTALLGIAGCFAIAANRGSYLTVWAIVGFATAAVTASYGVVMWRAKSSALKATALEAAR